MRILRLGLLFAVSLLSFATAIQAQQAPTSTPAPRDAQAALVLQRSLAALTGTVTVNDVTLTGTATRIAGSDDESGTGTLKGTAVGQGRVDLSLSSGPQSDVVDVSQVPPTGNWSGTDGAWHPMVAHNLWTDPTWFFPQFLIRRALSTQGFAISSSDSEVIDNLAVQHMVVWQQSQGARQLTGFVQKFTRVDIYLDSSSLLPYSVTFNIHPDNTTEIDIPVKVVFSDYRNIQGVLVPYHIQKYVQNTLMLDFSVETVQPNSGLSAADFSAQ